MFTLQKRVKAETTLGMQDENNWKIIRLCLCVFYFSTALLRLQSQQIKWHYDFTNILEFRISYLVSRKLDPQAIFCGLEAIIKIQVLIDWTVLIERWEENLNCKQFFQTSRMYPWTMTMVLMDLRLVYGPNNVSNSLYHRCIQMISIFLGNMTKNLYKHW